MRVLVVKSAFKDYQTGDRISDGKLIADILNSPQSVHVIASEHPDVAVPVAAQKEQA